jgi:hypothetical protein
MVRRPTDEAAVVASHRSLLIAAASLALLGCQADSTAIPAGSATTITVVSGNDQLAELNDTLPLPVRFRVTDARGTAVRGSDVQLLVTLGDGRIPVAALVTDDSGDVTTPWVMGNASGVQSLEAHAAGIVGTANARLCAIGECYPSSRVEGPLANALLLDVPTYEGSGQAVHPDVVAGSGALSGFWLALTPYPNGNVDVENPSIFRSAAGTDWIVPAGVHNPLALPGVDAAYLSDPDMVFNTADQRLWLFYRGASNARNIISVIRSSDGSHWDTPTAVLNVPSHQAVSPTIVRGAPQAAWVMWAVNAGPLGCAAATTTVERRTSTDGLRWSAATTVDLVQPGEAIWHIDIEWIPARSEYWAIYNTYPIGSACSTHSLYIAQSKDGIKWTVSPSPIIRSGINEAFHDIVYRSTLLADSRGNRMTLWISGARYSQQAGVYTWRTATVSTTAGALLAIAAAPRSSLSTAAVTPRLPNPEPDGPPR